MAILRPDGDVTCSLSCSTGTSHCDLIDESTLDTADYVYKTSGADRTTLTGSDLVSVGTFTRNATVKTVVGAFNIYLAAGSGNQYAGSASCTIKIYKGTTELASATASTNGWNYVTYTGDLTQAEIDDLRAYVYFSVLSAQNYDGKYYTYPVSTGRCYMAYIYPDTTLQPGAISNTNAFGITKLKLCIRPTGVAATNAFGASAVSQGNVLAPSGIASLEALGSPNVIMWVQIIAPPAITPAFMAGSPSVIVGPVIKPSGIASAFAAGSPRLSQGIIRCSGIPSVLAFGLPAVLRYAHHIILEAAYFDESPEVNRSYVVGVDAAGSLVSGNAVTQGEVDLVGERLEVQHEPAAYTGAVAGNIAAAVLAKARLDGKLGSITIPPHCALELWDVLNIVDAGCNQSASYRVAGYIFEYDVKRAIFHHEIDLSAP